MNPTAVRTRELPKVWYFSFTYLMAVVLLADRGTQQSSATTARVWVMSKLIVQLCVWVVLGLGDDVILVANQAISPCVASIISWRMKANRLHSARAPILACKLALALVGAILYHEVDLEGGSAVASLVDLVQRHVTSAVALITMHGTVKHRPWNVMLVENS